MNGDASSPIVEVAAISPRPVDGQPAVPSDLLSATAATQVGPRAYHIPAQLAMAAWLYATGPISVTGYNFKNAGGFRHKKNLASRVPYEPDGKRSPCDGLRLTDAGHALLATNPSCQVYRSVLACSGKSAHGKAPPNCQRLCGGIGMCFSDCADGRGTLHNCAFRVEITASLEDAVAGRFKVRLFGTHVPEGTLQVPPPADGLHAAPHITAALTRDCLGGL